MTPTRRISIIRTKKNQEQQRAHYRPRLIVVLQHIVNNFISLGCTANLCVLDLSKAFDTVNHQALFIKHMKRHIPNELLELFENWFTNCYSCIKWANVWSDIFRV